MTPYEQSTTAGTAVPVTVAAALAELDEQYEQARALPQDTPASAAVRCARFALVCARRAGWWRVLSRWAYRDGQVHPVFARAVVAAEQAQREAARFWRDTAADWRAHAERRPDSGLWATGEDLDRGRVA